MAYDLTTDAGLVRLLLNDVDPANAVFTDAEINAFLTMEGGSVKKAAAQAIDTNADNELLASKVITSQDVTVNGAAMATAMRARATALRQQDLIDGDDGGYFEYIPQETCESLWGSL